MRVSRRPVRVALLSGAALLSVGAGVGIATATDDTPSQAPAASAPVLRDTKAAPVADAAPAPAEHSEGPGTETAPAPAEGYEGPGTETVPAPAEGGEGYEGPGTDAAPAPVYTSVTPSTWALAVPKATVYATPGSTSSRTGTISDASADIAGTGRAATVGRTPWVEVKVPGATTGWVVGTELQRR